tara:strand:- start:696 stop:1322 length:627 start_codon:yes stop_codon:yes gene_type:complete
MIDNNQIYILDNIIPPQYQKYLFKAITEDSTWVLNPTTSTFPNLITSPDSNIINQINENFQFINTKFVNETTPQYPSNTLPISPILHYVQSYFNYSFHYNLTKLKINLQTSLPNNSPNTFNIPHIDNSSFTPYTYTLIYYANDSDGDTIIFNEKFENSPIKNFSIYKKITPKKGRVIIFPTNTVHCGSHPTKSISRIVININFEITPN